MLSQSELKVHSDLAIYTHGAHLSVRQFYLALQPMNMQLSRTLK